MPRSLRLFRILLALYPAGFRDEYGREIALVFSDRCRHASTFTEHASVWIEALYGVLTEAPKEHFRMFLQDLRYALRTLRNNPMFCVTVVAALALGIGANSATFSVLNAVVLRTLPVPHPEDLYLVRDDSRNPRFNRISWPLFEQLRQGGAAGDQIAAMGRPARMHANIGGAAQSEPVSVQPVSGEYFNTLNLSATRGRLLAPEDNRTPGAHPVAVISDGLWQRRFASSPDVIGQDVIINRARFSIIGVAPPGFSGVWLETPTEIWVPLAMQYDVRYTQNYSAYDSQTNKPWMPQDRISWLEVIVRAPAAPAASAALNTRLQQILAQRAESIKNPEDRRQVLESRLRLDPFGNGASLLRQRFSKPLYVLMAMAALVLLIACANTANLLLARAAGRRREMALRLSLGAGRWRLLRQLFTESLLLVLIAAAVALMIARGTSDALIRMATASSNSNILPFSPGVDGSVLAFTAAIALATALLFGLAPAIRASRVDLAETLKSGARSTAEGPGPNTPRLLVVLQVAVSLLLVTGTGLLVRSLQNVLNINLGFEREHILSIAIDPRLAGIGPERMPELYDILLNRVSSLPGVRSSAIAMCGIMSNCRSAEDGLTIEGYASHPGEQVLITTNIVSPGYFDALGMRLKAGRVLDDRDRKGTPSAVVVNEAFVRRYFRGLQQETLGKRFGYKVLDQQIVGVVEDARVQGVKSEPEPMAFFALQQRPAAARSIEIRTAGDPRPLAAAVRQAILQVAPHLPVEAIVTLSERVNNNLSQERLLLSLTSAFGALALGLAGFGLFGLLSYAVARRTAEFGIRLALGAQQGELLWSVLKESLLLAIAGVAIGLPLVLAGSGLMSSMLFGINPRDAMTISASVVVLVGVAALAGFLPAWRASRVDPLVALRFE